MYNNYPDKLYQHSLTITLTVQPLFKMISLSLIAQHNIYDSLGQRNCIILRIAYCANETKIKMANEVMIMINCANGVNCAWNGLYYKHCLNT